MVVQHNMLGINANRQLNITTGIRAKSSEKLSSGYRINRAADDAAGLAISEKMRRQIRGLDQASDNAQDGISWCQIADGALDEVSNMISRAKELAVQAANGTLTDSDRSYINQEMQKMASEIDRTHSSTQFNNINIFSDNGYSPKSAEVAESIKPMMITLPSGQKVEISLEFVGIDGKQATPKEVNPTGTPTSYGAPEFENFVKSAAASAVNKLSSNFPYLFSAAGTSGVKVGLELGNIDGPDNTLAYASLDMGWNSEASVMTYTMKVDTSDYNPSDFGSMTAEEKADLAGVIAHEMTHLFMFDTLTDGMLNGSGSKFPLWFIEGAAQTSSGDNGWVSGKLGPSSSDGEVKSYMSQLSDMPYGAGYLATMYLGYAVSAKKGNTQVTADNIKNGLNDLFADMASNKHSLTEAIAAKTNYNGLKAFENGFKGADAASLDFVKKLLVAKGTNGAGSLFGNLSATEMDLFGNAGSGASSTNYEILPGNTAYQNVFATGYELPEGGGGTGDDGVGNLLFLQVGSENTEADRIGLKRFNVTLESLTEGKTFDTSTAQKALETVETASVAGENVARVRSYYGALQNRLEHTIKNLDNVVENTTSSESKIRDTDMAKEMVRYSNNNILMQAGQAILAQANQTNQGVLALLQ